MDQDVQAPESLMQRQAQLIQAVALGDVHGNQGRRLACRGADLVIKIGQAAFRAGDGDHMCAALGERQGGCAANAAACARDEGDLVGKRQGHGSGV